ncbi:inositol monophosphatase family protein [Pseudoroseicyclus tamaricis]|uniref:Inositol monophosphatase n=1 Tax=Pseudoroseicyclus tamaricis TaxID=2705421 RepID=A0A6B2JTY7_9RHOB|nr:inositol monophosphatase [Pseudoroseicyclus tamaricis]NDV01405.1 inositol monophosphatase [Pseudoroseicyclus tamaricis]
MVSAAQKALLLQAVRDAARDEILPRFRALEASDISTKSGPSDLVTLADTRAEAAIAAAVEAGWPEARVIGEEGVAADKELRGEMAAPGPVVIVDPVDGTWNFAKGLAVFGVILAVAVEGRPVYGLLYDPVMDDWIEAEAGGPAEFVSPARRRVLATSKEERKSRMTGYVPFGLFPRPMRGRIAQETTVFNRIQTLRCSAHEYRMLAQGHVEFVLSGPVPHPWDHAAGVLAVERAGGVARFLDGGAYETGRRKGVLLTAGSEAAWEKVAERFSFLG